MSSQHQYGNTEETLSSPKFPSPYIFHRRDPLTLVELRMRSLSGLIRQKPRWWEKVQDEALVAKWRAEMVELDRIAFRHPGASKLNTESWISCTWDDYKKTRQDIKEDPAKAGDDDELSALSYDYQWLPTVFAVSPTSTVECQGYINNVHPIKHKSLYPVLTSILERFVPMFERVLSYAMSPEPPRVIEVEPLEWYDEENAASGRGWLGYPREGSVPLITEPPPFQPPNTEARVDVSLKGRSLQVIVKLANIVLTPEKPKYPGGAWHVEGMVNERIVATGLYYYACENITESRLAFRTQVGKDPEGYDERYLQNDDSGYLHAFGYSNNGMMNQDLGHVVALEDKCVAFPNLWQHRVQPFELEDPTKPGHRKILCFFLVNPWRMVHSTSDVPPQQREWYEEAMESVPALQELPQELYDMIASQVVEGTITCAEAEEERERLMQERSSFAVTMNKEVYELRFSLCEH
ncbi:hypothetical protein C8Q76DRAFT_861189 [Earliella scabrosa]|nr:hypothetical protein C8Q76DRAFT_861189 [Earliella scabrosa]